MLSSFSYFDYDRSKRYRFGVNSFLIDFVLKRVAQIFISNSIIALRVLTPIMDEINVRRF